MKKLFFAVVVLAAMVVGAVLYGAMPDNFDSRKEYAKISLNYNLKTKNIVVMYSSGQAEELPLTDGINDLSLMKVVGQLADKKWLLKTQSFTVIEGTTMITHVIMERDKK